MTSNAPRNAPIAKLKYQACPGEEGYLKFQKTNETRSFGERKSRTASITFIFSFFPVTPEYSRGPFKKKEEEEEREEERGVSPGIPPHAEPRPEPPAPTLPSSHSSTSINKHWEAELAALKGNNAKLTAALLESTANVKQWKQQLAAYQEEAERLHKRVTELECVSGQTTVIKSQKTELNQTMEELEAALRAKEEELQTLRVELEEASQVLLHKESLMQKLQATEDRNQSLEARLSALEQHAESSQLEREAFQAHLRSLLELLDGKIFELTELRDTLAKLIESS